MKIILLVICIVLSVNFSFAQDLRKKAEENPLDCAFYVIWQDKGKDRNSSDVDGLARVYWQMKRYNDVLKVLKLSDHSKTDELAWFAEQLIDEGKKVEAEKFLNEAVRFIEEEKSAGERVLPQIVLSLMKLNCFEEAEKLYQREDWEEDKAPALFNIVETYLKIGQREKAEKLFPQLLELSRSDNEILVKIPSIYISLKKNEVALKLIEEIKKTAFFGETPFQAESRRKNALFPLISAYLELGKTEEAIQVWNQYGDQENGYEIIGFARILLKYGYQEKALQYLAQVQNNPEMFERNGEAVVKIYLQIGEVETAWQAARSISQNNDSYSQQAALMLVTDKFIEDKNPDSALKVLDFAFQKARKIVFEHLPEQSNGASSGTRKRTYLGQIYERLMQLKHYEKAFAAIMSINSDHSIAKGFIAEKLIDFAKQQTKTLPRKKIILLLDKAQAIFNEEDEDYYPNRIKVEVADIYARIGDKIKAVELLSAALEYGKESCCYKNDLILTAGKVFEENNLQADRRMKNILKEFIEGN